MYFYFVEGIIYKQHKIKNKKRTQLNSLQVQGYLYNKIKKHNSVVSSTGKSTFLSAPLMVMGSMTIEAAITIPCFLLTMIPLIYFMLIINFQNIVFQNMTNTAKDISRYSYAIEKAGEIIGSQSNSEISQKISDLSMTENLIKGGLTGIYAFQKILDSNTRKLAGNLGIYDGLSGINMLESDLSKQENVDIAIAYTVKIPMVSGKIYKMSFINRCYFRNYIGKSIDIKSVKSNKTVYITKSGSVYHIYKDCTHIDLSILTVPYSDVASLRNQNGGKYKKCEKCVNKIVDENDEVVIATNGDRYHLNKECSGIIRNVIVIYISQIENRTLCKRCEEREIKK